MVTAGTRDFNRVHVIDIWSILGTGVNRYVNLVNPSYDGLIREREGGGRPLSAVSAITD
jgi:hypothetical protein